MGLFRRKPNPGRELAVALSQRGVAGRATVVAMHATGPSRDAAEEVEFTLDVELPDGPSVRVVHRQYMNRYTGHGLAPGEPARILYDSADPQRLMIHGHPRYRTAVRDGEIVVVAAQEHRGAS